MPTFEKFIESESVDEFLTEDSIVWEIFNQKEMSRMMDNMDDQTADLFKDVIDKFTEILKMTPNESRALNRMRNLVSSKVHGEGNLRNQVFKIANELKRKLPSGSF